MHNSEQTQEHLAASEAEARTSAEDDWQASQRASFLCANFGELVEFVKAAQKNADDYLALNRAYTDLRTPNKERAVTDNTAYRPVHFTPEEIAFGSAAIRWVTADGVCGRPTLHDVREYIERRGDAIDCTCERCMEWKGRAAAIPITSKEQEKDHAR